MEAFKMLIISIILGGLLSIVFGRFLKLKSLDNFVYLIGGLGLGILGSFFVEVVFLDWELDFALKLNSFVITTDMTFVILLALMALENKEV